RGAGAGDRDSADADGAVDQAVEQELAEHVRGRDEQVVRAGVGAITGKRRRGGVLGGWGAGGEDVFDEERDRCVAPGGGGWDGAGGEEGWGGGGGAGGGGTGGGGAGAGAGRGCGGGR